MRLLAVLLIVVLSAGFTSCRREVIRVPGPVQYRDRLVVEPIAAELLNEHPIASGTLSECPRVAAQRRSELRECNADKAAIRAQQEGRR